MPNAINSPTAQNLAHKSIIELANITYENARAAVEAKGQADDAAEAAAASASAADNSADLADLSKMAAAASAAAANADMITASNKAIAAGNSANAAANSASAAENSADDAAQSAAAAAAAMGNKVDKTTTGNRVYATADNGDPLPLAYSAYVGKTPGTNYGNIVYRAANGFFFVKNATADDHPAAYGQAKRFYASIHIMTDVSGEIFEYDFPRVLVDTYNTANLTTVKKISQHVISPFLGHETASGNTFHAVYVGDPDYTESICTINASGQFVPIATNSTTTVTVTIYTY